MKRLLFFAMCIFATYTSTYAQVCDGPLTVTIQGASSENPLEATETDVVQPSCSGPTGAITISITGGSPDYSIEWTKDGDAFSTDQNLIEIGGGSYEAVITDESGCSVNLGPYVLTEPSDMVVTGDAVNPLCNVPGTDFDGSITVSVDGGVGEYTYAWTTDDGSGLVADAANQSGLGAGTYTVEITDENGCSKTEEWTLTAPDEFTVSLDGENPDCAADNGDANGTITSTVGGGSGEYTYAWTTDDGSGLVADAADQSGLSAGTYTVVVTDENDCSVTADITLDAADAIEIAVATVDPDCSADNGDANGEIDITASGGAGDYTYEWTSTGGTGLEETDEDQTALGAGMYTVVVTDASGCSASMDITLEGPDAILVVAESVDPNCFGSHDGSITLTSVTGGAGSEIDDYSYNWNTVGGSGIVTTDPSQTGLDVGMYQLTVTDASGCTAYYEYELTAPDAIVITIDTQEDPSCNEANGEMDGEIAITASGGDGSFTYAWSSDNDATLEANATSQSGLSGGTYTVVVTDGNGCTAEQEVELNEALAIDLEHTVVPPSCAGNNGSIWIAISPDETTNTYTYVWSTEDGSGIEQGEKHQASLTPGTYSLVVTNQNGCTATGEYVVPDASEIDIAAESTGDILCSGEGTGEITVTASGGEGTFTYSIDEGETYQASNVFDDLEAGEYVITVKDGNGCTTDVDVTVEEPAALTGGTCTEMEDLCNVGEGEIKVQASGGVAPYIVTYTSSNGGTLDQASGQEIDTDGGSVTFTGAQGGKSYAFIITDANGCQIP